MSATNTIEFKASEVPLERVIVFNDRAEIKRILTTDLVPGANEVKLTHVTNSFVFDSIRVDGRGDAIILDVTTQDKYIAPGETDTPKVAELRAQVESKRAQVFNIQDRSAVIEQRIKAFDKLVGEIGSGVFPKEGNFNGDILQTVDSVFAYYAKNSAELRSEKRQVDIELDQEKKELQKLENELNNHNQGQHVRNFVIGLESVSGGKVQLDIVYQVYSANWNPSYDFRVETLDKKSLKITYYGNISQHTGEDWNDAKIVLSTAQPCLGGNIPELGTLEASFWRPPPPQPERRMMARGGALFGSAPMAKCAMAPQAMNMVAMDTAPCMEAATATVSERALSTEFEIVRATTIPTGSDSQKVTIGIVDIEPQLVHECVPSVNQSVFLTALAVNNSPLVLLAGEASVYLNNSFVAKTHLKNVSPSERFSCSLGVDTAIRVEYKPAKKNHEQTGIINKSSTIVTEQLINVKNTRKEAVLVVVKHHVPRSTDEKIKIRLIHPTVQPTPEPELHLTEAAAVPKEGAVLNAQNNLEWTVSVPGSQEKHLQLKWALDHPKEEKVEFHEKF